MTCVLITSADSPSGIALCRALAVRVQVLATGCRSATSMAAALAGSGVRYEQADLSHSRERRRVLFGPALEARVDAVVHFLSREAARTRCADGVGELLHLCERHPTIRQFVHLGSADIYRTRAEDPALIDEEHPLRSVAGAAPWLCDQVEVDQTACVHIGTSRLHVAVLRCAELFAPSRDGELQRWLSSVPCFRPLGFDPMVNLLSLEDLRSAVSLALEAQPAGIFNVPGADTMPVSELAERAGRISLAVPGFLLPALYRLRALAPGPAFDYATNEARFYFGGVLCGEAAFAAFGYRARNPIRWPAERPEVKARLAATSVPRRPRRRGVADPGPTRDRTLHPPTPPPA